MQEFLYFFGHGFCHQLVSRSFEAGGLVFSVCARDTGIYMGLALAVLVAFLEHARIKVKPGGLPPIWAMMVCLALILPMAFDGVTSYLGLRPTNNTIRYVTGMLCGMGVGTLLAPILMGLRRAADPDTPAFRTPLGLTLHFVFVAIPAAVFLLIFPYLGIIAPFIPVAAFVFIATSVNLVVITLSHRFQPRGRALRWLAVITISLALALIEITLLGALRDLLIGSLLHGTPLQALIHD